MYKQGTDYNICWWIFNMLKIMNNYQILKLLKKNVDRAVGATGKSHLGRPEVNLC